MPNAIIVSDLITSSMRLIGAIATGETPTADEARDGLLVLNDMLENWSAERLSVWGTANETFSTVAGQAVYTIGPAGDFNTTRPVYITDAYCTFGGVDFPVSIWGQEEYNRISLKSMQQPIVEKLLYVNDAPLGLITLWPVPSQVIPLVLSTGQVLTNPVTLATSLTGPPGFTKALRFCLAVEYAAEFGVSPPAIVVQIAADSKGDYKRANMVPVVSTYDAALVTPSRATWQEGY